MGSGVLASPRLRTHITPSQPSNLPQVPPFSRLPVYASLVDVGFRVHLLIFPPDI